MTKGIDKVNDIYMNRTETARELKKEGKKVIGCVCPFIPVEIITAAGLMPYRILGDETETDSKTEAYAEPNFCSFLCSFFDLALKGKYDFLDGLVVPHSCDHSIHLYNFWTHNKEPDYSFLLNVPHTLSLPSQKFFKAEINTFKKSIEKYTGKEISSEKLNSAISEYNIHRALVRDLYELRKSDPPLISGADIMKIMVAIAVLPVDRANDLLKEVIEEGKGGQYKVQKQPARLLVYGCGMDNKVFIELLEECGANVVMDDICLGARSHFYDVETTGDPIENIASHRS